MNTTLDTDRPPKCAWCKQPINPGEPMIVYGVPHADLMMIGVQVLHPECDLEAGD